MKHYLFVCYANRNRSPRGQKIFQEMLVEAGYKVWNVNALTDADYEVCSAGTNADENGNDMNEELGQRMDVVFALDPSILETLVNDFRVPKRKIINLDVPDIYTSKELEVILTRKLRLHVPKRE